MKYTLDWKAYADTARKVVSEGCVLLKNEGRTLPLQRGERVSVFGINQLNYYKSGTGSGGMVHTWYEVSVLDALKEEESIHLNQELLHRYETWQKAHPPVQVTEWAAEPWSQQEMELTEAIVTEAAKASDIALIMIGRTAGEDRDNHAEAGSYLLSEAEETMLKLVCSVFPRTAVLLNVGNIIDMKFVQKYQPQAVMYVWQGGMEGGRGTVDVLMGRVSPSGRLTDTIAYDIADYPTTKNFGREDKNIYEEDIYVGYRYFETAAKDKVIYPFGYGLSYTSFTQEISSVWQVEDVVSIDLDVTNIGEHHGKEVVQIYYQPLGGKLCRPARNLLRFYKTQKLKPMEKQRIISSFRTREMAAFDDSGITGHKNCYVLEKGSYKIYVGANVRDAKEVMTVTIKEDVVTEQLQEACAPVEAFERMAFTVHPDGSVEEKREAVPMRSCHLAKRIADNYPKGVPYTGDRGYRFKDVMHNAVTSEEYLAQFTDEDLICMARGEGMCSAKVTPGIAGSFGGVTESLQKLGMPIAGCSDGPSGIRMDCGTKAFLSPNATMLASTFNLELAEELYQWVGLELRLNKIDMLLGPGMNIHRNPLNGRNFEYFSEDPYITGKMAAAVLRGLEKYGVTGTIKHFACNDQEFGRNTVDAVVSQRALREIHLKGFEIAVKEGKAFSVMTSYNPLNGIWTAGNYDLNTTILRKEWGFTGMVMSDWWAMINEDAKKPAKKNNISFMIRAQNDVYMVVEDSQSNPFKDDAKEALEKVRLTRGELVRNAANIISVLMRLPVGKRKMEEIEEFEIINTPRRE